MFAVPKYWFLSYREIGLARHGLRATYLVTIKKLKVSSHKMHFQKMFYPNSDLYP